MGSTPIGNKQPSQRLLLASTGLPVVECKLRASQCRGERYAECIIIERDPTRDLQFLISEHRGSSGMVRQCLKLLFRETAPISGVLPRANDIRAGLCWGVDKSFHEALLSMCVAQLKCCACAGETVKENPALIERCCGLAFHFGTVRQRNFYCGDR